MPISKIPVGVEPNWVTLSDVIGFHDVVVKYFGASSGFPHPGGLDSAINAPRQHLNYTDSGCDLYDLAAVYLYHIAKAHAFVDGNKRTAYLTALVFLRMNEIALALPDNVIALAEATEAAAAGLVDKPALAATMRRMPLMKIPRVRTRKDRGDFRDRPRKVAAGTGKRPGKRRSRKRFF